MPETLAPVVILVRPQMGENIGAAARAMLNFGLDELRLVDPRDGWPNEKARATATPFMRELRHAVGLRPLQAAAQAGQAPAAIKTEVLASFKQYREQDGRFYFKLVDATGQVLLQSRGFDSPREAGQAVKRLQTDGAAALDALGAQLDLPGGASPALRDALQMLQTAQQT